MDLIKEGDRKVHKVPSISLYQSQHVSIFTDRNQLASIAYDSTAVASFTYDDGAREISRTLGNNLTQTQSYRNDNLLAQKSVSGITNFSYTYNANKNKLAETDNVNTNLSQNFSYDREERLTSWSSNGSVLNQNQSWSLSLEGAWNSTTVNGITENRTFNEVYEILTSNSNHLTHDRKGNLTQNKDASQYTWDYNNQLSHSVNASSESASYTYDAIGRRISKQVVGTLTVYINIGYQIATEYQSTDGINFSEKQSYVYATYIDDPLVLVKASGERFYYHSNGQFSISKITDEYKNVVEAYAYNAYGDVQILQSYAGLDNPYYFTGRQLDQETGLFYFRARYYDAKLGQFISRDPIGYVDGMSLYRGYFAVYRLDASGTNCDNGSIADTKVCCDKEGLSVYYNSKLSCCKDNVVHDRKYICDVDPIVCLTCILYAEARGQSSDCIKAVWWVIKNRMANSSYPSKLCDVISQKKQFSGYKNHNYNECVNKLLKCPFEELTGELKAVHDIVIGGLTGTDTTGGALFYNNAGVESWASKNRTQTKCSTCSKFDFYL